MTRRSPSDIPLRVERFLSSGGLRVYRLPVEAFPGLVAYVHLVLGDGVVTMVDVGSGYGSSNQDLTTGFDRVREEYGENVSLTDVRQILITHGHIDHFGGLAFVRDRCAAPVGVHELDLRVLNNYEERLVLTAQALRHFLAQAGVSAETESALMSMYMAPKALFHSIQVAFTYETVGMAHGQFRFFHVPGHCPGQVVIQVDDLLLSADHVLSHTTPHQSPEALSPYTGLGHYFESLRAMRSLTGVRLALGGHEEAIPDLAARIDAIERMHRGRLEKILDLLAEPKTIVDVSRELFGPVKGYHVLLAIEEAGSHVEYLAQRGQIAIENLKAIGQASTRPVPIVYRRLR